MSVTCPFCDGEGVVTTGEGHERLCVDCAGEGCCDCGTCEACVTAAEAAWERRCEDFHGGGGPLSIDEQHRAAWAQKQGLRS